MQKRRERRRGLVQENYLHISHINIRISESVKVEEERMKIGALERCRELCAIELAAVRPLIWH